MSASGTLVSYQNDQFKAETQLEMDKHNITTLPRSQSPGSVEDDGKAACTDSNHNILKKEVYDALAQRFTIIVAKSTLTTTAIITVLALARDIVNEIFIKFEISMFLGFLAAATHFFVVASILFITCILMAIHSAFVHKQSVYALYVYSAIGMSLIFYFTPFWKDSVLVWNLFGAL